ncbi:hypothetical protein Hanom_Chr03g00224831 [Helianthus anomalus]
MLKLVYFHFCPPMAHTYIPYMRIPQAGVRAHTHTHVGMSKSDPAPVPNRYRIYRTGCFFGTDSVPTFDIFGTGPVWYRFSTGIYRFLPSNTDTVPVPVGTELYRTRYIRYRYRYRYPLLGIFGTVWYRAHPYTHVYSIHYKTVCTSIRMEQILRLSKFLVKLVCWLFRYTSE